VTRFSARIEIDDGTTAELALLRDDNGISFVFYCDDRPLTAEDPPESLQAAMSQLAHELSGWYRELDGRLREQS
jgi:hypothetical protein